MSSLMSSHGVAFATAMAVSGTVILIGALRRPKPLYATAECPALHRPHCNRRSCISSEESKRERAKKKRRVHFAEELVIRREEYLSDCNGGEEEEEEAQEEEEEEEDLAPVQPRRRGGSTPTHRRMPANRMALYNGILQDRLQRMACSY